MKTIILLLFICVSSTSIGQNKYLTKSGQVTFEASVPSFEEVKATQNNVTAILNTSNGEFASLALVKGFRFKNALMEEHFNENYAESDKYSKTIFKGTISDFNIDKLGKHKISGQLTFHGVTNEVVDIPITISKKDNKITISGTFSAKASDYNIDIPKIVSKKIAEDIEVSFNFELEPKE